MALGDFVWNIYKFNFESIFLTVMNGISRSSKLEKKIKQDKKCPGVLITDMRKSSAIYDIVVLIREGIICMEDLEEFSEDLQETVNYIVNL